MGSFNIKCMVSQQVISEGDKVVSMFVKQQTSYSVSSLEMDGKEIKHVPNVGFGNGPSDLWDYASGLLEGEYDDYGEIVVYETDNNKICLKNFIETLSKKAYKSNDDGGFDMAYIIKNKNLDSFEDLQEIYKRICSAALSEKVFVRGDCGSQAPCMLKLTAMHKSAMEYLIYGNKDIEEEDVEEKKHLIKYIKEKIEWEIAVHQDVAQERVAIGAAFGFINLDGYGRGCESGGPIPLMYKNHEQFINLIKSDASKFIPHLDKSMEDIVYAMLRPKIDHKLMHRGLSNYNIRIMPMVLDGQDYSNESGKRYIDLIKFVGKDIDKNINKRAM